jgi:hypothetical protein
MYVRLFATATGALPSTTGRAEPPIGAQERDHRIKGGLSRRLNLHTH